MAINVRAYEPRFYSFWLLIATFLYFFLIFFFYIFSFFFIYIHLYWFIYLFLPFSAQVLLHCDAWLPAIMSDHTSLCVWLWHVLCRFYWVSYAKATELFIIFLVVNLKPNTSIGLHFECYMEYKAKKKQKLPIRVKGILDMTQPVRAKQKWVCHTAVSAGGRR